MGFVLGLADIMRLDTFELAMKMDFGQASTTMDL
jgi:hypothetical protein